jgi:DNA-binding transcriptional regulator of glucitol operon
VAKRGKSSKGENLIVAFVIIFAVVAIFAGWFQAEEMNKLFNWIFH